jgi:hypothetical protein
VRAVELDDANRAYFTGMSKIIAGEDGAAMTAVRAPGASSRDRRCSEFVQIVPSPRPSGFRQALAIPLSGRTTRRVSLDTVSGCKDPLSFHKMELCIPFLGIWSYTLPQ